MTLLFNQNKKYIYKVAISYTKTCDMADLMQEAYIGLHNATQTYDAEKGIKFITYAGYEIRRCLSEYTRNNICIQDVPSYLIGLIIKYHKFRNEYVILNSGKKPTQQEYMEYLNLSEIRFERLLKFIETYEYSSLDKTIPGTDDLVLGDLIANDYSIEDAVISELVINEVNNCINRALNMLNTKYKYVIKCYFIYDMSLEEIAEKDKIPLKEVKRIYKKALERLCYNADINKAKEILGDDDGQKTIK